ncbi:MAG: prolyl aminopeptidase [Gammaproteobacteria bacterium]
MADLFPDIQPYVRHTLEVDEPHRLYVEESGNPEGIPVVFVHGGPGAGTQPGHRRFFDPQRYRIVLFDQRGCGRSAPHASLEGNTTQALVGDMEFIRKRLGIERWMVFGGSWGSTLGLVYAQTHPERVLALVLRGIFLCRARDVQWFYQDGASRLYPDHWEDFLEPIPAEERHDMVSAYYARLTGDDEVTRMAAAKAWSIWEARASTLRTREDITEQFGAPYAALSLARIECHYFMHDSFLEPGQILRDAHRLADIPGVIVHGRYDTVCPVEQAWLLHQAWPQARLRIVPAAGHSVAEPAIAAELVAAPQRLADQLA